MSFETTMAWAAARAAEAAWQRHWKGCIWCRAVRRVKDKSGMCTEGARLLADRDETRAEARRQAELDKLPVPGQGVLFTLEE